MSKFCKISLINIRGPQEKDDGVNLVSPRRL